MAVAENEQLHFVLFPFMAQGHTIPMMDIAKLLAQRGVKVTLLLTPMNHARLKPVLRRAYDLGLRISVEELSFPGEEAGLPAGCENFDALPSNSLAIAFFVAVGLIEPQVEKLLQEMHPKPSCLLADMCHSYASKLALKLGFPRIYFNGMGCFARLCWHYIWTSKILDGVSDDLECFDVPGMPKKISFTIAQVRGIFSQNDKEVKELQNKIAEDEKAAYGLIYNTFEDLETIYIRDYEKVKAKKVWTIGPVSLCNNANSDKLMRGNASSVDQNECLKWLDSWKPGSVTYVCLGSLCNLKAAQMLELGLGLEASGRPFIWVIRSGGASSGKELKTLMAEIGFEERLKTSKGLLIWGWAPQVLILSHPSVGGFLTHCGWNSSLEGVTAGVPMLTWPLFAEQFINEKLIVDELNTGMRIGVKVMMEFGKEDQIGLLLCKEGVTKAVEELMGDSEEAQVRRKKARELAEKAKKAVDEGGSSHVNIGKFIEDIRTFKH